MHACVSSPQALILSGHEGDQCEVPHNTSLGVCTEVSKRGGRAEGPVDGVVRRWLWLRWQHVVGTFNWLPGQPRPAFRIVGLGATQVASRLCYLPPQRQMLVR